MKKILAFALLIILTVLIETSILSNMYFLPAMPDLMLIMLLFISIKNGSLTGEVTGFSSGLVIDFLSATPFGLNSLVRTIIGYIAGLFHLSLETSGIFSPAILGFIATIIKALLLLIISCFYTEQIVLYSLFSSVFWLECLFNAILAPIVFKFLSFFKVFASTYDVENF